MAETGIVRSISNAISKLTYQKVACFFAIAWARFLFGAVASQLGEAIAPGTPAMSLVMAALSQAGATGAMWSFFTATCEAVM